MIHYCPNCGGRIEAEDAEGGLLVCRACGAALPLTPGGLWIDVAAARHKVRPPAIGLMIIGVLVILCGMFAPALVGFGVIAEGVPAGGDGPDAQFEQTMFYVMLGAAALTGFLSLAVGGVILLGGYRMYELRSWTLALIASILSIMSVIAFLACCFVGLVGVVGLPGMPVGIWALVVLCDANVKGAFQS